MKDDAKNCMNCGHRAKDDGNTFILSRCMISGKFCDEERIKMEACDINFSKWIPVELKGEE